MKGLTASSVEGGRERFLSLAADIFPHYITSASQAFLVTLTVLPDLSFFAPLSFPIFKDFRFPGNGPVPLRISSRAEEDHQSTADI